MTDTSTPSPILHPLDQLRGLIRRYVLIDGLLTAGLFAILWFWIGLAADYGLFRATHFDWVLDAPKLLRVIALAALTIVLVGILVTRLWLRLHRELSYPNLALILEKRFPHILGDKLITAVELADVPKAKSQGYSEEMLRATIDDAREQVAKVPVRSVFNWRRLRIKAVLLALFALGTLVALFATYSAVKGSVDAGRFVSSFSDVSLIWAERNLILQNTPWPRQAHLELINFTGDELRIAKDSSSGPRIQARAYRWLAADRNAPHGWRPMLWKDLPASVQEKLLLGTLPPQHEFIDIDRLDTLTAESEGARSAFMALTEMANDPANSRRIRKLAVPDAVTLSYAGPKSSGKVSLTRETDNVFTGEVSGLKESVRFTVKGADFSTLPRSITLVPPPLFTRLVRTEYQPAYLYHAPPVGAEHTALKGLRQTIVEKDLSLTGDKTVFSIVQGTEFDLAGTVDKKLAKVLLKPKVGPLPGQAKAGDVVELTPDPGQESFRVSFRGPHRPQGNLEFDIVLVDLDNVTTTRTLLVQVTDDQPPSVELAVDVLRKQGNTYLVTPTAMVPFITESKVRDDFALAKVNFHWTLSKVESNLMVALQAQTLASMVQVPLSPTIADAYLPAFGASLTNASARATDQQSGVTVVPRYGEQFRALRRDTPEALQAKLAKPVDADAAQIIREVKFNTQNTDVFDLREAIPNLGRSSDGADFNQRWRLELNLMATDANVESGPKTGSNLEPIRLLVIQPEELLGEISRDEQTQAGRLDDVIKKLKEAQSKLNTTAERLTPLTVPPDILVSSAVRAQDIAQDIAKCREITSGVLTEYRRLYREMEFNRLRVEILNRVATEIIAPLDAILDKHFTDAEKAHGDFLTALAENRRPDDPITSADRMMLAKLLTEIETLRGKIDEQASITKLKQELTQIRDRQITIGKFLKSIYARMIDDLNKPRLLPVTVELAKGETKTIKQGILWQAYVGGPITVSFSGPDAVKLPQPVKVPDDRDDFDWIVTAGDKPGDYLITLTPSVGSPLSITVKVK